MVTKKKSTGTKAAKKSRVKVKTLTLNKETVRDLTSREAKKVKGGERKIISLICEGGGR